VVVLVVVVVL